MGLVNGEANMISSLIVSMGGESGTASWTRRVLELLPIESRYCLARTCKWMYNCAVASGLPIFCVIYLDRAVSSMSFEMVQFLHHENLLRSDPLWDGVLPQFRHCAVQLGQWMVDNCFATEMAVLDWALKNDFLDLVQHAIEKNWDRDFTLDHLNTNMAVLELLYTRKHIWKEFHLTEIEDIYTEDALLFIFKHRSDPMFNLDNALGNDLFQRLVLENLYLVENMSVVCKILRMWWSRRQRLPQLLCHSMPDRIRAHICSTQCNCADPDRHEQMRHDRVAKRPKL